MILLDGIQRIQTSLSPVITPHGGQKIQIPAHLTQFSLPLSLSLLTISAPSPSPSPTNNNTPQTNITHKIHGDSLPLTQMTRSSRDSHKHNPSSSRPKSDGPEMRIIVPLQGVVQGRGGLVLGSLLPCALFYFLQLYLKSRNRPSQSRPSSPSTLSTPNDHNLSPSSPSSASGSSIHRTLSRGLLSPRAHPSVSSRAAAVARPDEDSSYYVGLKRYLQDAYHRVDNPEGIIQLGLAENRLSQDLVLDWLEKKAHGALLGGERPDELSIMGLTTYQPYDGSNNLKIAMAGFMSQVMQGSVSFDPSQIVLTCGATPAVEILSFCIADPGNAFLVPSPYYPGWDRDIKLRTSIELVPVPCRSTDNFSISIATLERVYTRTKKRGLKIRAVLIANPTNPTGHVLSRETLIDLLDFVTEKNIHLISDEVFAGSIHGDQSKFVSVAELLESEGIDKTRVHIIYGLSKDLPLAGFRVGVIHSYNDTVIAASAKLARFSSISAPTQQLLISMLSDMQFISDYLEVNQQRLRRMHSLFVDALKQLGIKCANSNAGFYCWADMSRYIEPYSEKGERKLWEKLLTVAKVNMTPGLSCHCIEPGWFRCCFTTLTEEDIPLVVERIKRVTQGPK